MNSLNEDSFEFFNSTSIINNINTVETDYGKISYYINDYFISQAYKYGYVYEQQIVENELNHFIINAWVILDIGAHIGSHSIMYSKINPESKIYSFEIQKPMYKLLQRNVIQNRLTNIELFNCAVGNKTKMVNINNEIKDGPNANEPYSYNGYKEYNFGGISLGYGGEEIMMITIDSLQLNNCDLIKIDVEGFEFPVLLGAINTIIKYKPAIFYEKNEEKPLNRELANIAEIDDFTSLNIESFLMNLGYKNFISVGMNMLAYV